MFQSPCFLSDKNPYLSHHALSLVPSAVVPIPWLFRYAQHSPASGPLLLQLPCLECPAALPGAHNVTISVVPHVSSSERPAKLGLPKAEAPEPLYALKLLQGSYNCLSLLYDD